MKKKITSPANAEEYYNFLTFQFYIFDLNRVAPPPQKKNIGIQNNKN